MGLTASLSQSKTSDRLASLAKTQPFSPVALRLLQLVREEDVSFREVAVLMSRDPALSAEVLRLANSPVLGIRCEVRSVLQAISLLGLRRIVPLFMTSAVGRFCWPRTKSPLVRQIWRHGLAAAFICEHLGPQLQPMDHVYTAGLLHGLGQTALLSLNVAGYEALACTSRESTLSTSECEMLAFGVTHSEAGGVLLEKWRLPEVLVSAARCHEEPCDRADSVSGIVQAGCRIAEWLGFGGCQTFADIEEPPLLPRPASDIVRNNAMLEAVAQQINAVEIALWV